MSFRLPADKLLPAEHACYYLYGDDEDGVFEIAEALLQDQADGATLLRVDVNELPLIHENLQPGLFGEVRCHALLRNAGSARVRQLEQLEKLAAAPPDGLRLIICAPAIDSKKPLHRRMTVLADMVCCEVPRMDEAAFTGWLADIAAKQGLHLSEEARVLIATQLCGMRMAARQAIERLRIYDAGEGLEIGTEVVGDLLGERSPRDLNELCAAVGQRNPRAIGLLRGLLREQQVAEVQVLSWLSTRLQQLLLFAWHQGRDRRNASRNAGLFGEARRLVPSEAKHWQPAELMQAMQLMIHVEMQLKGASLEAKPVVLERFVAGLVAR